MGLEPQGFVARIAEDLERTISQGRLPKDGSLPSEQSLARFYGVSRTTVREALKHLAARGVVVQHPGRRNRAAPLDVAVTLENLSMALHAIGPAHPERLRLLEGYLALKRETAVELLAICCERASQRELDQLLDACFILGDAARMEPESRRWAELEFGLLRMAACVAERPGHFLLIQSLEKSFWGMAGRLTPHLDSKATHQWAQCTFQALLERDAQAVRRDLPALLKACDERLLNSLARVHKVDDTPVAPSHSVELNSEEKTEPVFAASEESPTPVPASRAVEPRCEDTSALEPVLREESPLTTAAPPGVDSSGPTSAERRELPGAVCANRSACRTGSCKPRPTGGSEPCGVGVDGLSCHPQAP